MRVESILCKRCGKKVEGDWRRDVRIKKLKPLMFCSRSCANSRGARSQETKLKISKTLKHSIKQTPRKYTSTYIECTCPVCGNNYKYKAGYIRKTCSNSCANLLHSINRQKFLRESGTFSTKRETFEYKGTTIDVDSNLEKAGIVYLIDELGATNIERYVNILNYWEGDTHRTFNPDFICNIKNETCIIEIKQLWLKNSLHPYNRTIPLKRDALQKFCSDKKYHMLWIDFETTPLLKKIYKNILASR